MLYTDFEAGGKAYKLRLDVRGIVSLEKSLGCNPLMIFTEEKLPTVTVMCEILHQALQPYEHGMTLEKTFDIFGDYLADGHTPSDFVTVILEIYKASGLLEGGEGKN